MQCHPWQLNKVVIQQQSEKQHCTLSRHKDTYTGNIYQTFQVVLKNKEKLQTVHKESNESYASG